MLCSLYDAFSLLLSKLIHAKLFLCVFGATFAASLWQFIRFVAALFVTSVSRLLCIRDREGRA